MCTKKTLSIPQEDVRKYNALMQANEVDYEKNDIPRWETVKSWTVDLGDGYEADIKICSAIDGEPLWCEGVLFLNGCECCCTEVNDRLDGMYCFEHDRKTFAVTVEEAED